MPRGGNNKTHGLTGTSEYYIWKEMRQRCGNPSNHAYDRYGGRGIKVCKRWETFSNFLLDVGPRPSRRHSLDRIDNNKGYNPGNVKWATAAEQGRNTRRNRWITYKGERLVLQDWAKRVNLGVPLIIHRLKRGWSVERALTERPWGR